MIALAGSDQGFACAGQNRRGSNELARVLLPWLVEHFGDGDLSARIHSKRNDEIGHLARVFNRMADQIQTLLRSQHQLLQNISHELRSPLTRLGVAVELTRSETVKSRVSVQTGAGTSLTYIVAADPGAYVSGGSYTGQTPGSMPNRH